MISILVRDLWTPIWPNIAASVIWAAPVLWHHIRLARAQAATHQLLQDVHKKLSEKDSA